MSEKNAIHAEEVQPTPSERFFFDNNGYLVLENFLSESHVAAPPRDAVPGNSPTARKEGERNSSYRHDGMLRVIRAPASSIS